MVLLVVVIVATLPVPIVALLQTIGEAREESAHRAVREAASELRAAIDAGAAATEAARTIAGRFRVRAMVLELAARSTLADEDRDPRVATYAGVASINVEADSRGRAPVGQTLERDVVRSAREGRAATACANDPAGALLVCESAALTEDRAKVVYALRSERSDAQRLASTQRPLSALTAFVLASGLLLAWWLIARIARPLDALRSALAQRAKDARTATTPIEIEAPIEVAEVVSAHNRVLAALRDERLAKERLSSELVHEIKSPLAAIRIAIEQLDERAAAPATAAVKRIDRTVAMLLELSRAEAGLEDEPRATTDLRAIVEEATSAVPEREAVRVTVRGKASARVARESLRRALQCMVENAVSFAKTSVAIELAERGDDAVITVSDDGAGIEAALVSKVFDRFFSGRREAGGTGIGLALVRAVVQAHGGSVSVRSTPGEGATFALVVPRADR